MQFTRAETGDRFRDKRKVSPALAPITGLMTISSPLNSLKKRLAARLGSILGAKLVGTILTPEDCRSRR